jgi:hypothetical protein
MTNNTYIYKIIFCAIFLIFYDICIANSNVETSNPNQRTLEYNFALLPNYIFGVPASLQELDKLEHLVPNPIELKLPSGTTLVTSFNKMGFDFIAPEYAGENWLIQEYIQFASITSKPVLDIGACFGYTTNLALNAGATVIANDIEVGHLVFTRRNIDNPKLKANLYLNLARFPYETSFPPQSLSAVIIDRILHFLKPAEIEDGLDRVYEWLEPGGKIFIAVLPPQQKEVKDWLLPIYESKWQAGDTWPGIGIETSVAFPRYAHNLPKFVHIMDDRPLTIALKNHGFTIERSEFIKSTHMGLLNDSKGNIALYGIIAQKAM